MKKMSARPAFDAGQCLEISLMSRDAMSRNVMSREHLSQDRLSRDICYRLKISHMSYLFDRLTPAQDCV
jgi:hypothetical protein